MEWDENRWCRCRLCGRPALAQLGAALAAGVARGVVLMDASYGTNSALRAGIGALALTYVAAILPTVKVREVGDPDRRVSAKQLALTLPNHTWRTITWRDGSADPLRSRFARVRVRTAPIRGAAARPEETLLIEWQHGEAAPPSIGFRMLPRRFHSGNCSTSPKCAGASSATTRHIPNSIATIHCEMVVAIARMLPRCPCCPRRFPRNMR
jgi:DDE superfamily endonuclease